MATYDSTALITGKVGNGRLSSTPTAPRTAAQLKAMYGFDSVIPDSGGGYYAYSLGSNDPIRFVPNGDGDLVQEGPKVAASGGSGAQAPQGQYINGPDGRVYYAAPYGGGLTEVGNLGVAPEYTAVSDRRTGKSRLFDPNSGKTIDLGQTDFAGMDPREIEGQRRFEADREFARASASSAQQQASEDRRFEMDARRDEANADLQNRQLRLQAANSLTSLAESQENRKREILKGASDFVYRAFSQRGETSPEARVTHADLINNLGADFDRIASLYSAAIQEAPMRPLSSNGRLSANNPYAPTTTPNVPGGDMSRSPAVSAPPSDGPRIGDGTPIRNQVATYDENGNINGWGDVGGANTVGPNIPQAAPAPAYSGGGGGGYLGGGGGGYSAPAPAPAPAAGLGGIESWDYDKSEAGRYADDGGYQWDGVLRNPDEVQKELYPSAYTPLDRWVGDKLKDTGGLLKKGGKLLGKFLSYEEGGALQPGQPAIVGEEGFEIIWTNPDTGETEVIPHEIARTLASEDGDVKAKGRLSLPGYDEGTAGYRMRNPMYAAFDDFYADAMRDPSQFFAAGPTRGLNQFGGPIGEVISKGSPTYGRDMNALRRLIPTQPQLPPAAPGRLRGFLDKIPGFADGTFFNGWNGQDAAGMINQFNSRSATVDGSFSPGAAAGLNKDGTFGTYGRGVYGGSAYNQREAQDWEINNARYGGKANNGGNDPWNDWMRDGRTSPKQPAYTAFSQLTAALRGKNVSQESLQADEKRLRPPAVDAILKGGEMPRLRIPGLDGNAPPEIASRMALDKMTPDELTALNTSLGVAYNTTLEDYLAASDQRFLAGQGQSRLRTMYR